MKLIVSPAALKRMADVPKRQRALLMQKLDEFAAAPFERHPAATPLKGRDDVVRIRQGDWRAICRVDRAGQTVVVDSIAHRREAYQ